MSHEVICIDEDYDPRLQYVSVPAGSNHTTGTGRVGTKRSFDGVTIRSVQRKSDRTTYTTSDGMVLCEIPASTSFVVDNSEEPSGVIVDGSDVYYIDEIDGPVPQVPVVPQVTVPWNTEITQVAGSSQLRTALEATTTVSVPVYVEDSDDDDEDDEPQVESIVPEEEAPQIDEYYEVEPLELSEVWNDLITANQEILILLELQDLRHHIVDARKIEDQFTSMACEYCPKVLSDIRAWNRHIKKIHFQTEEFACDICNAKFKYYARFKDHLNAHNSQRPYKCDECDHNYAFRIGFLVHKILEHMKLNGIYVCPKCNRDCKDAANYKLHIAKHIDNTAAAAGAPSTSNGHSRNQHSAARPQPAPVAAPVVRFPKETRQSQFLSVFEQFSMRRDEGKGNAGNADTLMGKYSKRRK